MTTIIFDSPRLARSASDGPPVARAPGWLVTINKKSPWNLVGPRGLTIRFFMSTSGRTPEIPRLGAGKAPKIVGVGRHRSINPHRKKRRPDEIASGPLTKNWLHPTAARRLRLVQPHLVTITHLDHLLPLAPPRWCTRTSCTPAGSSPSHHVRATRLSRF